MAKSNADYTEEIIKKGLVRPDDIARFGVGDANFDAKRNKSIIERTIQKTNARYKSKAKEMDNGLQERSHLIASYLKHMEDTNKDMPIEKYAGWEKMKAVWGEARAEEIRARALLQGHSIK